MKRPSLGISLRSPLTLRNAFLFPIQNRAARRDVLCGALLLLLPGIGWMLNMGHRLRLVHRMHRDKPPWPAWDRYGQLFCHGALTTLVIVVFQLPGALLGLVAARHGGMMLWVVGAAVYACGLFLLPGFMTFYARDYDARELLDVPRAVRRVLGGGRAYLHAWGIVLVATAVSFFGLLVLGGGFLVTSVWLWQVAAFCFARVFSERHGLFVASGDSFDAVEPDAVNRPGP